MPQIKSPSHQMTAGLLAGLVAIIVSGCTQSGQQQQNNPNVAVAPPAQQPAAQQPQQETDQGEILQAQQDRDRKVEVTVGARVIKKLPDDTKGLPHERFLIRLSNGSRVLVAHDTKVAPYVPLQEGDYVRIHGEYIWNERGGVLHWTHRAFNGRHEPGWIEFNGKRYE